MTNAKNGFAKITTMAPWKKKKKRDKYILFIKERMR